MLNKFYAQKIKEIQAKFQNNTTETASKPVTEAPKNTAPTASPADAFEPATNFKEKEHDDLPF